MKGKTKNPSGKKGHPTARGKGAAEIDNPQKTNHDGSEDLNADELAAFEKIMGDIDNQEEEQLSGTAKGTGGEEDVQVLTEAQLASLNEAIETIDSEDHTEIETTDPGNTTAIREEDDGDESLDEDQQRAFERIMAQIESGGADDDARGTEREAAIELESDTEDDFDAKLEKVVDQADADDSVKPAETKPDEMTDDGLDPDQQEALDSIMAQINGDRAADVDTGSEKETAIDPGSDSADEGLNGDQLQAFESIMAQIEGVDDVQASTEPDNSALTDPSAGNSPEDRAPRSAEPIDDDTDNKSQDSIDDIDIILAEIASTDNTSLSPKAAVDDAGSEAVTVDSSEKPMVDDDRVAHKEKDNGFEQPDRHQAAAPSQIGGKTTESVETPLSTNPPGDQISVARPALSSLKPLPHSEPQRKAKPSTGGRQKKTVLTSMVVILFLAMGGYFYGIPQRIGDSSQFTQDTVTNRQDAMVATQPVPKVQKPVAVVQDLSDQSRLKTAAENLDHLRNELIDKQAEIGELRAYYQAGIDAEIQGIIDRVRRSGKSTIPFKSAMDDPHMRLGLSAIQRRDSYISKLETPVNILFRASEELLFFSRKAGLLALMAGKTSDIDVDGFIRQADEIRNIHSNALAQLNIDTVPVSPPALESIWRDIEKRLTSAAVKPVDDNPVSDTDNPAIWKNICDGDFTQKDKLTALSPDAARCLATYKGKDLFLNALTDLSPDAARHLAAWEGDWLGLNGLTELSPEVALHLSRWKGKGLSLNGLSRLSARVVAILSDWQGNQIELVNVKHMAHWENPKTKLFLSEDLKRKHSATRK